MRRGALLLAILLLAGPLFTGCLGGDEPVDPASVPGDQPLELDTVPASATVEELENGLRLLFEDVDLPFEQEIEIPDGTTMVQTTGKVGTGQGVFVHMANADTGRRRCNVPYYQAWDQLTTGEMTCSGVATVDPLPATWEITVRGPAQADVVTVDLLDAPLDGIAAKVDTANLSMPTHDLQETQEVTIESFDGTPLYAQVTLPEGDGPWPVALASSPYNSGYHATGEPAMWEYFVKDWAKRGYAVVMADVRGTGRSDGCMEVWGENEQQDQVALVEWAAEQDWSDGNVGFYGQSYVGTTPVEAAVRAPPALKAIIAVAPVIDAYNDWHFGGVPNGENLLSPAFYQASTGGVSDLEMNDPARSAIQVANGLCDPTLTAQANDPRAVYDSFYEERNFSTDAGNVEAAVLYTQGFEDTNVKSAMALDWFNAIDAPKLGLFGHWVHQHPVRADNELLFLVWMDQHVKGKDMGLSEVPAADIVAQDGTHRLAEAWPPVDPAGSNWYPDFTDQALGPQPTDTTGSVLLDPSGLAREATSRQAGVADDADRIILEGEVAQAVRLAGQATLRLSAELQGTDNAHVAAYLYDTGPDGPRLVTFGMANLAHRNGHDGYEPVPPATRVTMGLPMLPTEHVFEEGHTIRLVIRSAQVGDWAAVQADGGGALTLHGGADGTVLKLPKAPDQGIAPLPLTASP